MGLLTKEERQWEEDLDNIIDEIKKEQALNTYKEHSEKDGCKIYTKEATPTNKWKGVYKANIPAEAMLKAITSSNLTSKQEWDPTTIEIKDPLKVLDKHSGFQLLYAKHAPGNMISNRDFILVRKFVIEKNAIIFVAKSVNPSEKEFQIVDPKCVRGECIMSGHYIEILENNKCRDTYYSHVNLNGWIPTWAFNQVSSDQALVPLKIAQHVKKNIK
jgi:hypothetical protein